MGRVTDYTALSGADLTDDDLVYAVDTAGGDRKLTVGALKAHISADIDGGAGAVQSVNDQTGAVTITAASIGAATTAAVAAKADSSAVTAGLAEKADAATTTAALAAKADDAATTAALATKAAATDVTTLGDDLGAVDIRLEAVEDALAAPEPLAEPTVADILTAADKFLSNNPKTNSDTMTPLVHGVVGSTLSVDATLRREQIWTLSGNLALNGITDTLQGSVKLRFKSTGPYTITPAADIRVRSADTSPIVTTNGKEACLVISARTDSGGTRRTEIERIDVFDTAPLVAPNIVSTSISTGGLVQPWSNTPGATFTITENVTGNLAPTVTRTMTFNGAADAQTSSTFSGPTGLKGKFRITTAAINASGSATPFVTEAWIGLRAPDFIGETHGDRTGTTAGSVNVSIHGSALAGDMAILATVQQSASDIAPPTGFVALDAAIPRIASGGTTSGNNMHFQLFYKVLDAADILAGLFAVSLNGNSFALLTILRGCAVATWDNADFTRSAALVTTATLNSSTVVATDAALELMYVYSGSYEDGPKIASATGFTLGTTFDLTGSPDTGASDYGCSTLRREVSNGTLGSVTVTVGTGQAKTTQITRLLAYGPTNV